MVFGVGRSARAGTMVRGCVEDGVEVEVGVDGAVVDSSVMTVTWLRLLGASKFVPCLVRAYRRDKPKGLAPP